jgi:hypothetical protein
MDRALPAALFAALVAGSCSAPPDPEGDPVDDGEEFAAEPGVPTEPDPRAAAAVKAMAGALRKAGTYSVRIESWSDDPNAEGGLVAVPTEATITVRRPDGFHGERRSDRGLRRFWYDGKSFSALDAERGLHATVAAPATIEGTVDMLEERFGLVFPLADLLVDDPADSYSRSADSIAYHGVQAVSGVPCHHLGFASPWLEWQVWIAAEGEPLPRRVQITYLDEPGEPRFLATLSDWKLGIPVAAADFAFTPPAGSTAVVLAPLAAPEPADAAPAAGGR